MVEKVLKYLEFINPMVDYLIDEGIPEPVAIVMVAIMLFMLGMSFYSFINWINMPAYRVAKVFQDKYKLSDEVTSNLVIYFRVLFFLFSVTAVLLLFLAVLYLHTEAK